MYAARGDARFKERADYMVREPNAEGRVHEVDFTPCYRLPERTYGTYWDVFTRAEWAKVKRGYAAEADTTSSTPSPRLSCAARRR